MSARHYLIACGFLNSFIAIASLLLIFFTPNTAYLYEALHTYIQTGASLSTPSALMITFIFVLFAAYSFSAAGLIKSLPYTNSVFSLISGLFLIRALAIIPQAFGYQPLFEIYDTLTLHVVTHGYTQATPLDIEMSLIAVFVGAFHWYASYYMLKDNVTAKFVTH